MPASPDEYARVLQAHLEVNPKSWEALQARGVDENTPVQLDFEFTTTGEESTRELMRFLRTTTDYEFQGGAQDKDDGSRRWVVLGTTSPMTLSLDGLNEWTTRMTDHGRHHGPGVFDGWGARIPETKAATRTRKRGGFAKLGRRPR